MKDFDRTEYFERIFSGVLNAVVMAYPDEEATGGFLDWERAQEAICRALATIANQTGEYPDPKARREFAEKCAKEIRTTMTKLQAVDLGWPAATPVPDDRH